MTNFTGVPMRNILFARGNYNSMIGKEQSKSPKNIFRNHVVHILIVKEQHFKNKTQSDKYDSLLSKKYIGS